MKYGLMSQAQAAEYLGVSKSTLSKLRMATYSGPRAQIKFIKMGRTVKYRIEDLDEYIDSSVKDAATVKP